MTACARVDQKSMKLSHGRSSEEQKSKRKFSSFKRAAARRAAAVRLVLTLRGMRGETLRRSYKARARRASARGQRRVGERAGLLSEEKWGGWGGGGGERRGRSAR